MIAKSNPGKYDHNSKTLQLSRLRVLNNSKFVGIKIVGSIFIQSPKFILMGFFFIVMGLMHTILMYSCIDYWNSFVMILFLQFPTFELCFDPLGFYYNSWYLVILYDWYFLRFHFWGSHTDKQFWKLEISFHWHWWGTSYRKWHDFKL